MQGGAGVSQSSPHRVTGLFASNPKKWQIPETGKQDGKRTRHPTLTPCHWMLSVGAKGAFSCWHGPGCRECQRQKRVWKANKGREGKYLGEKIESISYKSFGRRRGVCAHMREHRMQQAATFISQDIWHVGIRHTSAYRAGPETSVTGKGG